MIAEYDVFFFRWPGFAFRPLLVCRWFSFVEIDEGSHFSRRCYREDRAWGRGRLSPRETEGAVGIASAERTALLE